MRRPQSLPYLYVVNSRKCSGTCHVRLENGCKDNNLLAFLIYFAQKITIFIKTFRFMEQLLPKMIIFAA
jgi:hypothetical protein